MVVKNHREILSILMFGCIALGIGNSLYNPSQFTDISHTHLPSFMTSHSNVSNNGWIEDEDTKKYVEHVKSIIEDSKNNNIYSKNIDAKNYLRQNEKMISNFIESPLNSKNLINNIDNILYVNTLVTIEYVGSKDINKGEINELTFMLTIKNSNHESNLTKEETFTLINYKDGSNNLTDINKIFLNLSELHHNMDVKSHEEKEQLEKKQKNDSDSVQLVEKIKDLASKIDGYEHDLNNNKNNSEEIKNILEKVNATLAN